jgi:hypothetical protein
MPYDVVISERSDELRFLKVTIEPVTEIQTRSMVETKDQIWFYGTRCLQG